jgi:N-acetyl sugar amidotransferase
LRQICDRHRRTDGYYDCVIPVSGGKDSHFLVYTIKKELGMNPLLITVGAPFEMTKAGQHNYRNLGDTFNCDHILFDLSIDLFRRVTRMDFEMTGEPLRFVETALYIVPIKLAMKLGIRLIVYGENSSYEYGSTDKESPDAMGFFRECLKRVDLDFWRKRGIPDHELNAVRPPSEDEMNRVNPEGLFMSYFSPWSSMSHLAIVRRYGFTDLAHEWKREGYIEDFEQIDSIGYLIHLWMKYPKFGFQRVSDIASRRIREGLLSLEEGKRLIRENDPKIDQRALQDYCQFLGYSTPQFWEIADKYWNRDIFDQVDGIWKKKIPVM